ncbi:MAG: lysophospholipase [Lachnospiraceae bacterium]|nr:lysophospholipase [Lachnospiraceae bacterium]
MSKEVYTFKSADGVSTIHAVKWLPDDGEVKAVLQITHGMVEYIERYEGFAEFLNSKNFAVIGHDHIGHGESVSTEEDWGIMHCKHPSDVMVEDIYSNYKIGQEQFADKPYFILGHSMGSYMLRKFLCEKADSIDGIDGAIIMGTGTEANGAISAGKAALAIIAAFKGIDYRSKFIAGLMYGSTYKGYDTDGTVDRSKSWLNRDVVEVNKYYSDPKCTYMFSLNGYRALLEATGYDNKMENINKMRKDMPIFFASGSEDPVGAQGKGVEAAKAKFDDAGIQDVSIKLYEGYRHEILNEIDKEVVYNDLYEWMTSKCK